MSSVDPYAAYEMGLRTREEAFHDQSRAERLERCLLSSIICDPRLRLLCIDRIRGADFATKHLGRAFDIAMGMRKLDLVLLVHEMETRKEPFPPRGSWAVELALVLDSWVVDEDNIETYIAKIKELAIERQIERRVRLR